ncbi:hypothetical protein PoB_001898300 [Plakobranchus ocellatus]|uniref:Uncharacterized protein n=1 Tax=Plakobranchus ocellatus TaxID=259542 RepID=A0AAV3ZCL8_9GAST|nr:hypothetical protein PoB_001898300 [Plakobranchus ocellatus]
MFGLSKKSHKPTTFFALALCVHIVAFCLTAVGMFTPHWAEIREETGTLTEDFVYDRGLVVSCVGAEACKANENVAKNSELFVAAYVLGIMSTISAFFILQTLALAIIIKSCREFNLAGVVAGLSFAQGAFLALVLILFELSIGHDTTEGYIHRKASFGYSRGLILCAAVLYMCASLLVIVEHVRRRRRKSEVQESYLTSSTRIGYKQGHRPSPPPRPAFSSYRGRRSVMVAPMVTSMPPGSSERKTSYNSETVATKVGGSPVGGAGMYPCETPGCQACAFVGQSDVFLGPGGVPFKIRERLDCRDRGVVYAVTCMRDNQVFIGHSEEKLETTFSIHMANVRAMNLSDPVAYHFTRPDHKIQDLRVTALGHLAGEFGSRDRLEKVLQYDMDKPHNSYSGMDNNFTFL